MNAVELLPRLRSVRVLVVGDVMQDEYVCGDCSRLSPEAVVPVLRVQHARQSLGGAANTAANIASLGARVVLIGMVGQDSAGDELIAAARAQGVEFAAITDSRPTIRKVRIVSQNQQIARLDFENTGPLSSECDRVLRRLLADRIVESDIVIVSDYAKGLLTRETCQEIIRAAHCLGREVIVDPKPQNRRYYVGCDCMTPNWKESQELLGRRHQSATPARVANVGRRLVRAQHADVLLTLGAAGVAYFSRRGLEDGIFATAAKQVVDVSGAGDTLVAVYALGRAAGVATRAAIELANRAAGIVVAKFGTSCITAQELFSPSDYQGALVSRADLAVLTPLFRAGNRRVVVVFGKFDRVDESTITLLREARDRSDVVIIGLVNESGSNAPQSIAERAHVLAALRMVDCVHILHEDEVDDFIVACRPDAYLKTDGVTPFSRRPDWSMAV